MLYDEKGRPCVSFGYAKTRTRMWAATMLRQHHKGVEQILGR